VFVDRSQPWIWSLLIGVLGIVAGIVVLNHPALTALALPTTSSSISAWSASSWAWLASSANSAVAA
jgi:uncharacterized membrane protein HdeD (DUF308 family)